MLWTAIATTVTKDVSSVEAPAPVQSATPTYTSKSTPTTTSASVMQSEGGSPRHRLATAASVGENS